MKRNQDETYNMRYKRALKVFMTALLVVKGLSFDWKAEGHNRVKLLLNGSMKTKEVWSLML